MAYLRVLTLSVAIGVAAAFHGWAALGFALLAVALAAANADAAVVAVAVGVGVCGVAAAVAGVVPACIDAVDVAAAVARETEGVVAGGCVFGYDDGLDQDVGLNGCLAVDESWPSLARPR